PGVVVADERVPVGDVRGPVDGRDGGLAVVGRQCRRRRRERARQGEVRQCSETPHACSPYPERPPRDCRGPDRFPVRPQLRDQGGRRIPLPCLVTFFESRKCPPPPRRCSTFHFYTAHVHAAGYVSAGP